MHDELDERFDPVSGVPLPPTEGAADQGFAAALADFVEGLAELCPRDPRRVS
ncbi:MAG: hypothetical protein M3R63_20955 [Actinomycetota bacterium]|nr:hypothetical protein [Actinomycetota bacterium]